MSDNEQQTQDETDVDMLAQYGEEAARPIAAIAAMMAEGSAGRLRLVFRALDLAMQDFAPNAVKPERVEHFERACRAAADRILAGWRESEQRVEFRDALNRATQVGGAA